MSPPKSINVLVADDNDINQRVIKGMLEHAGYDVTAVSDGGAVLEALGARPYDLVIMDCMMPVLDGYETTRAIRESDSASFDPDIPVLAITALAAPGDREKCLEAGMDDYISKPVVAGTLYRKIEQLLVLRATAPGTEAADEDPMAGILASLSGRLLEDLAGWQQELDRLRGDDAVGELGRVAHKIRGSADVFGARRLSGAAAALESAARHGDTGRVPELAGTLRQELERLEARLGGPV